jgi:hypothetical protein
MDERNGNMTIAAMNKEFLIKFEGECEVIHRRGGDSSP